MRISDWSSDVCSSDLGIKTQRLYQEEYLCFGKEDHPFIRSGETDDFMAADHIVVSTKGMAHAHRAVERALLEKIHPDRSEEHTSGLQSLMRISYAVFCLKKKKKIRIDKHDTLDRNHEINTIRSPNTTTN